MRFVVGRMGALIGYRVFLFLSTRANAPRSHRISLRRRRSGRPIVTSTAPCTLSRPISSAPTAISALYFPFPSFLFSSLPLLLGPLYSNFFRSSSPDRRCRSSSYELLVLPSGTTKIWSIDASDSTRRGRPSHLVGASKLVASRPKRA